MSPSSRKHRFVFPLGPSVMVIAMLIALVALGSWQLSRLQWKEGVLGKIHENLKLPPISIETVLDDVNPSKWDYRKVHLRGTFLHDLEVHLVPKSHNGQPGYHLIAPFQLKSGNVVLVNRGWISSYEPYEGITRSDKPVDVIGTISPIHQKGYFTPKNNFDKREIFYVDVDQFAQFSNLVTLMPIYVIAEPLSTVPSTGFPLQVGVSLNIPNNHFAYALTWFALALALLIIYSIFVYQWNHRLRVLND